MIDLTSDAGFMWWGSSLREMQSLEEVLREVVTVTGRKGHEEVSKTGWREEALRGRQTQRGRKTSL